MVKVDALDNFLRYFKKKERKGGKNDIVYECYINIILDYIIILTGYIILTGLLGG